MSKKQENQKPLTPEEMRQVFALSLFSIYSMASKQSPTYEEAGTLLDTMAKTLDPEGPVARVINYYGSQPHLLPRDPMNPNENDHWLFETVKFASPELLEQWRKAEMHIGGDVKFKAPAVIKWISSEEQPKASLKEAAASAGKAIANNMSSGSGSSAAPKTTKPQDKSFGRS